MSEQRPAVSYDEFLAVFPPQSTEKLTARGSEIVAEHEERSRHREDKSKHVAMLAELQRNPAADPNHILYYEQEIEVIDAKLERLHGPA